MLRQFLYGLSPADPLTYLIVGAIFGVAAVLSYTLSSAGKLTPVYGGFAGLVATLVFLYLSAVSLIFGAEINGVLRDGSEAPES